MSPRFQRARRTVQWLVAATFVTSYSLAMCLGQTPYTVGVTADVTGGAKSPNVGGGSLSQSFGGVEPFIGTYPSISFKARKEHSSLESRYGFGYDRNYTDPRYETTSHSANVTFSTELGPKWKFNLSDSFSMTSDIASYNLLSGSSAQNAQSDQFQFAFTPVFAQSNRSNSASASLDRTLNQKSALILTGTYSTLEYPNSTAQSAGVLSDQQRIATNVRYAYSRQHDKWSFGYTGTSLNFAASPDSFNHSAAVGYTHQFSPALSIQLEAGPSYVASSEELESPLGTNITAVVRREIPKGFFSLRLGQTTGDTSGLGTVSDYQEVALNFSRTIGRRTTISADVSGFHSQELQANPLSARGYAAGGNIALSLGRDWSMNWGGQYQRYEGSNTSQYDQKRIFASLRYSNPDLWRF
jgi:hypothetical protein